MKQNNIEKTSLRTLAQRLHSADRCDERILHEVINSACSRFQNTRARSSFDQKVRSGAWIDAVISLIALELPAWTLRRIVRDDGLWVCTLSRHPELPIERDDAAEAFHRDLPLAILMSFVEARLAMKHETVRVATQRTHSQWQYVMGCENFT